MNQVYSQPATGKVPPGKIRNSKKLFLMLAFLAGVISLNAQTWRSAEFDQFPFKYVEYAPLNVSCSSPPANAGRTAMIDVTKPPYNADKTGVQDATAAFRAALANTQTFVYIPNGTYRFTDSVAFAPTPITQNGRVSTGGDYLQMWGESRSGVKLVLDNNATGFNNTSAPKAFFHTGSGSPDRFNNSIWNVTFEIGTGNAGAIGLRHYLNNSGGLYNVTIRTKGGGKIGLDKGYNRANGPSLTKDVRIEGFEIGIKTDYSVESEVYEHVTLKNQTQYGFYNAKQILSIRGLKVEGCAGPAFVNESGFVNILDADLAGTGSAAIQNGASGKLLVRNLSTSGYTQGISDPQKPLTQTSLGGLYLSDAGIGPDGNSNANVATLNLQVKETPVVPWDNPSTWVDPSDFGATPNGVCSTTVACMPCDDDGPAIQRAIDATADPSSPYYGRTTLFLSARYRIYTSIRLRGSIRRVIGPAAHSIGTPANGKMWDGTTPVQTTWIVEAGTHPVVEFQNVNAGWPSHEVPYLQSSSGRTIVFKNCAIGPSVSITNGEVFIESSPIGRMSFTNAKVWARQFNPESDTDAKLSLDGSTYWGLGLKTERNNTIILARNGSKVEQFGGYIYTTHNVSSTTPMLRVENSDISMSMFEYLGYWAKENPYRILITDTKGSSTVTVNRGGTLTAPTYPATWSQCNDGTTDCTEGKVGSSFILYSNVASGSSDITLRNPENPSGTVAGLDYSYYEGTWSTLPNFDALTAAKQGNVTNFDLTPRNRNDNFAFKFTGYINVPTDGTYTFYTSSDDGSKLYIGNTQVVNNDGLHASRERSGTIGLKAGRHLITVTFFEATGGETLSVSYSGPGISKQAIPASVLSRVSASPSVDRTDPVGSGTITARGQIHSGEGSDKAFDNNFATSKWLDVVSSNTWIQYTFANSARYAVDKYTITSGNDVPERDPKTWRLLGTNVANPTAADFTVVDSRTDFFFSARNEKREFIPASRSTAYATYRLEIISNNGAPYTQLNEMELFAPSNTSATNSASQQVQLDNSSIVIADKISVFPNPVTDGWLTVGLNTADQGKKVDVTLSDLSGKQVYRNNFVSNGVSQRLNVGKITPGVYIIRITGANTKFNAKVVVQ